MFQFIALVDDVFIAFGRKAALLIDQKGSFFVSNLTNIVYRKIGSVGSQHALNTIQNLLLFQKGILSAISKKGYHVRLCQMELAKEDGCLRLVEGIVAIWPYSQGMIMYFQKVYGHMKRICQTHQIRSLHRLQQCVHSGRKQKFLYGMEIVTAAEIDNVRFLIQKGNRYVDQCACQRAYFLQSHNVILPFL